MTLAYADTGWMCSLYAPDAHTDRAIRQVERLSCPLALTWLHQVELRNAFRLRVFRKEISPEQREASFRWFASDVIHGLYERISPQAEDVEREAERLGSLYSERFGTRSLDILHVAMANLAGAEVFHGFDKRQNRLAKACGLNVQGFR